MQNFTQRVEKYAKLMYDAERYIWNNPETGYKEVKTSSYLAEKFTELGYELTFAEGITGFYTTIDTGRPGPTVLILGELDSVICFNHPECDKETGAVHACGHNVQTATLLGIAATLKEEGALDGLCGKIKLCAVPAEELLEIEFRNQLKKQGVIKYHGGKAEFLYRGYFDDVDLAFMVHITNSDSFKIISGMVGAVAKTITYKGKSAHAGGSPWLGNNALYAANCGINACNALRETFKESDIVRFHPIITKGGDMVNAIPGETVLEAYVRAKTFEAIKVTNQKINQALIGGALALNCNVEIQDIPAFAPLINSPDFLNLFKQVVETILPEIGVNVSSAFGSGSSDMGDLSSIMPVVHPFCPGAIGTGHGSDYYVTNPEKTCLNNAKSQLGLLYALLSNGGKNAKEIIKNYKAPFASKQEFLDYFDSLSGEGDRISYSDGKAEVKL